MFFSRSASRKRFRRELFRFPYEDEKKKKMTTFFFASRKKVRRLPDNKHKNKQRETAALSIEGKIIENQSNDNKITKTISFSLFFSSLDFNDSLDQIQGPIVTRFMTKLEKKRKKYSNSWISCSRIFAWKSSTDCYQWFAFRFA